MMAGRVEAPLKVTGRAKYGADHNFPGIPGISFTRPGEGRRIEPLVERPSSRRGIADDVNTLPIAAARLVDAIDSSESNAARTAADEARNP